MYFKTIFTKADLRTSKFWPTLSQGVLSYLRSGLEIRVVPKYNFLYFFKGPIIAPEPSMPCEMESKCSKDLKLGSKLFHEYTICDQKYSQNLFFKLGCKGLGI